MMTAARSPDRAPPLTLLCALGGLLALLINHVLLPGFASEGDPMTWSTIGRLGQFFALLCAVAGMVALPFAIAIPSHSPAPIALSKRVSGIGFATILLVVVGRAAFLDRDRTSAQHVFLALGAAHLLGLSLASSAFFRTRSALLRGALASAVVMVTSALVGQVMEVMARSELSLLQLQLARMAHASGEAGYLLTLLCLSVMLLRPLPDVRARGARWVGMLLLGMLGASFALLAQQLGSSTFGLVLYHAQHVRLLLEGAPLSYGVPICSALAGGLAGLVLKQPQFRQLALATLLLLGAGYNPRAPGQLLLMALGLALLSRAGRCTPVVDTPQQAPTRPDTTTATSD